VSTSAIRAPRQARSRDRWDRALAVARELFERGGIDALTVSEVCRRASINPPSLYARVDGRAGLFAAVWEQGMAEITASEQRLFLGGPLERTPEDRIRAAATGTWEIFREHRRFLRPVISYSITSTDLRDRGAETSRRLIGLVTGRIAIAPRVDHEIARTIYAEVVLRTMWGDDFLTGSTESEIDFIERLVRAGLGIAAAGGGSVRPAG
jgi:AcrR family transcriptional regulator